MAPKSSTLRRTTSAMAAFTFVIGLAACAPPMRIIAHTGDFSEVYTGEGVGGPNGFFSITGEASGVRCTLKTTPDSPLTSFGPIECSDGRSTVMRHWAHHGLLTWTGKGTFADGTEIVQYSSLDPAELEPLLTEFRARAQGRRHPGEAAPAGEQVAEPARPDAIPDAPFNVLEAVVWDPETRQLTLVGRLDLDHLGPPIPYLDHLDAMVAQPAPEISLAPTAETERKVDAFLARMDSLSEMGRAAQAAFALVDDAGRLTPRSRVILPMLGIHPTLNGRAPGSIGARFALDRNNHLQIVSIEPGGPADRIGLRAGDVLPGEGIDGAHDPAEMEWAVRRAGAGSSHKLWIEDARGLRPVDITLDPAPGDPWQGVETWDVILQVLRADGHDRLATVMDRVLRVVRHARSPAAPMIMIGFLASTGRIPEYNELMELGAAGRIDKREFTRRMMRTLPLEIDLALGGNAVTSVFDAETAVRGPEAAFDAAMAAAKRAIEPVYRQAWTRVATRRDIREVPLDEQALGFRPEVEPRLQRLDPTRPLARVLFEADYLGKALVSDPELAELLPGHQTLFAFEQRHLAARPAVGGVVSQHLWISVADLEMRQSASGDTLSFGSVRMKVSVAEAGSTVPSHTYGDHLTGLYPQMARTWPVYHELREAAKLSAAALWLKEKGYRPGGGPSAGGRQVPARATGAVVLSWTADAGARVAVTAFGGASLVPPVGPAGPVWPPARPFAPPVDASVVDLRGGALTAPPASPWTNEALARVLRGRAGEIPVPRPDGWVVRPTKGERTLAALAAVPPGAERCEAQRAAALAPALDRARQAAVQLAVAERLVAALNAKGPGRQSAYARIAAELDEASEDFELGTWKALESTLTGGFEVLRRTRLRKPYPGAVALAREIVAEKKQMETYEARLKTLNALMAAAHAGDSQARRRAVVELGAAARDMLALGRISGGTRGAEAMRAVVKVAAKAKALEGAYAMGTSLLELLDAAAELRDLERAAAEDARLRDKLLPIQRRLSDRLDEALREPEIRDWLEGRMDCPGG